MEYSHKQKRKNITKSHIGEVSVHLEEGEVCGDGEILRRLRHLLQLRIHRLNKGTLSQLRIKTMP
jgi:hypothetical protein